MHSVSSILSKQFSKLKKQRVIANAIVVVFSLIIYIITQFKIDIWVLLTTFGTVRLCIVVPTLYLIFFNNPRVLATALSILIALAFGLFLQSTELSKLYTVLITIVTPLPILLTVVNLEKIYYNNRKGVSNGSKKL